MKTSEFLNAGKIYTRADLKKKFDITAASINTGVFRPAGHESIWLFVTEKKTPDRTQYHDLLDGDLLDWDGQMSGRTDSWIFSHARDGIELVLFYRLSKRQFPGAGFIYEGKFEYVSHSGSNPTHFTLSRVTSIEDIVIEDLSALAEEEELFEGTKKKRQSSYYERNPKLRAAALRIHGYRCQACGFHFEERYGSRGSNFIEVHHLIPVASLKRERKVDPETEMRVVCSNCHRMIHRKKSEVLTIDQVKQLLQ